MSLRHYTSAAAPSASSESQEEDRLAVSHTDNDVILKDRLDARSDEEHAAVDAEAEPRSVEAEHANVKTERDSTGVGAVQA